jgi:hypothetical protein
MPKMEFSTGITRYDLKLLRDYICVIMINIAAINIRRANKIGFQSSSTVPLQLHTQKLLVKDQLSRKRQTSFFNSI